MRGYPKWIAAAFVLIVAAITPAAHATEEGRSLYLPGTYSDFSAGVFGPSGLYFRNDFFAYHGTLSKAPVGGRLFTDLDQRVWINAFKFSLVTDTEILGARYGTGLSVPIVLYSWAEGFLEPGELRRQNDRTGLGDLYFAPLQLNWRWQDHHLTLSHGIFAPSGSYNRRRVMNLGRNHWGFDTRLAYTWLHGQRGHEFTVTAGYLINTRNHATNYRSGDEVHLDYLIAQHLFECFGVGFTGYWYKQVTGDDSPVLNRLNLGSFRGEAAGIGVALLYRPTIGGRDLDIVFKWLHDVHAARRFQGSEIMLSVALKFGSRAAAKTSTGFGPKVPNVAAD